MLSCMSELPEMRGFVKWEASWEEGGDDLRLRISLPRPVCGVYVCVCVRMDPYVCMCTQGTSAGKRIIGRETGCG